MTGYDIALSFDPISVNVTEVIHFSLSSGKNLEKINNRKKISRKIQWYDNKTQSNDKN